MNSNLHWKTTGVEDSALNELEQQAAELRRQHWHQQAQLDWQPVGDFSFYDHVLDTSLLVGNLPKTH